ncbi:uncharacterized protein LOC112518318 [Cynara cardunculus var. scolymus]|uniref:Alpha crystallin/Hsp20 domain-containing protein n=1 Tax=Cynara cardunculus var. scolymus TaxID=59895 RepID=A0A103XPC0_CYNCS|nr:uncharacterized protein LOC112518318 [Cynara cardunculus var. scolymus]KVH94370.1 hypothetical protein Ccrd_003564 [Cynara cardunculus var. scolymus]
MKVHPAPNRRNITVRYDFGSQSNAAAVLCRQKKLRRLPHIFAKVLELPFYSDADVSIHETSDSLKFVVDTDDDIGTDGDIAAHTIEIYPGVTKIVVGGRRVVNNCGNNPVNELELDVWRFRLPASTLPELATASFSDGELVVVVPKDVNLDGNQGELWVEGNETGQFVLVQ